MSRAVVRWSGSGRPEALRNTVPVMPSWRARAVICAANCSSVPPRNSATATATSLPDLTASDRIALSASIVWPALMPILDGGWRDAFADTGISVVFDRRPWSIASNSR